MTSLNNIQGFGPKTCSGSILYREVVGELELVISKTFYNGKRGHYYNYFSSELIIEVSVAKKGFVVNRSTNGVEYFFDYHEEQSKKDKESFSELREFKTKDGFIIKEVVDDRFHKDYPNSRTIVCKAYIPQHFLIEVLK